MKFGNGSPVSAPGGKGKMRKTLLRPMSMPDNPTPPAPDLDAPTAAMITFASDWQTLTEPSHTMALDEAMRREMVLATGTLASRAGCTHVAVQSGDWTAATTWLNVSTEGFEAPGAGAKLGIPSGITVTMDNNTTTEYDTLRVDGAVVWAVDQNTRLEIDTIIVNHGGSWTRGTSAAPITSTYTSILEFPDNGNLDPTVDTLLLGRGLISMGTFREYGATKTPFVATTQNRTVGATTITLSSTPSGWVEGDELFIAGTDMGGRVPRPQGNVTEDRKYDVVTITAINLDTNVVTFTPALQYARTIPTANNSSDFGDLAYHVVNGTRNVKTRSPSGTAVHHRGHVILMEDDIDVRWSEYTLLGRTRKGATGTGVGGNTGPVENSFNATDDAYIATLPGGVLVADSNIRGRYNLHVHRTGTGGTYGEVVGVAASKSPGWIYAHHEGNCNFRQCVGYDYTGGALVAEVGSESGTWDQCFMGGANERTLVGLIAAQKASTVSGLDAPTVGDLARFGDPYWIAGRNIAITNCIASDGQVGYFWMSRFGEARVSPNPLGNFTPEPRIFYGAQDAVGDVRGDSVVIPDFKNNICYSCIEGGVIVKILAVQRHHFRSNFFNFLCWNVDRGLHFDYTGHYSMKNIRILRADDLRNSPVNADGTSGNYGIILNSASVDMSFEDIKAAQVGTSRMLHAIKWDHVGTIRNTTGDHDHLFITNTISTADPGSNVITIVTDAAAETRDTMFVSALSTDAKNATLEFEFDFEPVWPNYNTNSAGFAGMLVQGQFTTEYETRDRTLEWRAGDGTLAGWETAGGASLGSFSTVPDIRYILGQLGYWTYTHPTHGFSRYALVPDLISKKLLDVNGDVVTRYLTLVVRINTTLPPGFGINYANYTNNGALPTRYVDAIALGDPDITDPGSPDANAGKWIVYEDILA